VKLRVAVLAALGVAVPLTQARVDASIDALGPEPDTLSVWTGPVVRSFSFGFADVLADLYWLRAVQYYGRQKLDSASEGYVDLLPLLETAAELDPRFTVVYRYGAVFLSEPIPVGAGRPEAGVAFLGKGADRNPENWQLRQEEGMFTSVYLNDPIRASQTLSRAATIPGAPWWMSSLAAFVLTSGGEYEASVRMWTLLYEQAPPGPLKANAESQLLVARSRLLARQVEDQVRAYREKSSDASSTLRQLRGRGVITADADVSGTPFDYDPESGSVRVSRNSPHWRR
jgi:hypothetical protein